MGKLAASRVRDVPASLTGAAAGAIRDAASLIVLDRDQNAVLMGRRSMRHVFMPGVFVFPGGRVDPSDARVSVAAGYDEVTLSTLTRAMRRGRSEARARALGVAALRETCEETGLMIGRSGGVHPRDDRASADAAGGGRSVGLGARLPKGRMLRQFAERDIALDLSPLRFLMRAITPPGRSRRFDTRFLVVGREHVAATDQVNPDDHAELEEIGWYPLHDARRLKLATITTEVLDELSARLAADPSLPPIACVPCIRWHRTAFVRSTL